MQKLIMGLPLLLFIVATVMFILVFDQYRGLSRNGDFGEALIAVAITYVASAIACRQQSK